MFQPYENPLVEEKDKTQKRLFEQVNGDIRKYRELNEKIAKEVNEKHPELRQKELSR
jgi:hypothetical protein